MFLDFLSAFPLHGTARYGSVRFTFGGFSTGYCTWYFFSTTSAEVPSDPYRYQNVTCKLYWFLIGRRKSSLLRHWTCDTRPSSTAVPARFKSAQPAKDRTQLLFKQMHIFASTTKQQCHCLLRKYKRNETISLIAEEQIQREINEATRNEKALCISLEYVCCLYFYLCICFASIKNNLIE